MKIWPLSHRQAVTYAHHRLAFETRDHQHLILRKEQFWNLHDIIRSVPQHGHYPLGRDMWLHISQQRVSIENQRIEFIFRDHAWQRYKRRVHWQIRSFLRHEHRSRQLYARAPSRPPHRSRAPPSPPPPRQIPSCKTTNARDTNVMRSESTTLPEWMRSNPRQTFSFKSAVHELRNRSPPTSTLPPPSHADIDIEEFSSVCSIEDEYSSSSY